MIEWMIEIYVRFEVDDKFNNSNRDMRMFFNYN